MARSRLSCRPAIRELSFYSTPFSSFCLCSPRLISPSTGYGQHGDYVFGWKDDSLQHAMDNRCFGPTCKGLTTQGFDKANKCTVNSLVKEDNEGCKSSRQAKVGWVPADQDVTQGSRSCLVDIMSCKRAVGKEVAICLMVLMVCGRSLWGITPECLMIGC